MVMAEQNDADKILAKAMMYLFQTAANDGIITEEEANLINSFELSLKQYDRALRAAFEDNIITREEKEKLIKVKEIIINSGRIIADEIDGISKDEMNLLISMMLSLEVPKESKGEFIDTD